MRSLHFKEWTKILGWPGFQVYRYELDETLKTFGLWVRRKRGTKKLICSGCGRHCGRARSKDAQEPSRERSLSRDCLHARPYRRSVALEGQSKGQVHGLFRIHGTEHEITLPFQVQADAGQVTATLQFRVFFVKWGMKNPSAFLLKETTR